MRDAERKGAWGEKRRDAVPEDSRMVGSDVRQGKARQDEAKAREGKAGLTKNAPRADLLVFFGLLTGFLCFNCYVPLDEKQGGEVTSINSITNVRHYLRNGMNQS